MGNLNKEGILALQPKAEPVEFPGGDTALIRGMRGLERDAFEASLIVGDGADAKRDISNLRARVVVRCLVDEAGNRLFRDDEAGELGAIAGDALDRLYDVAARLSGIGAKDLEKATKN